MPQHQEANQREDVTFLVSSPPNILTIRDVVLDSPVWRANVLHLEDQIDQFEKWIDGFIRALKSYIEATIKHNTHATTLCKRTFFNGLDGSLIDNKIAGNVVTKFATTLQSTIAHRMKMASDLEELLLNPLQNLLKNDLKYHKDSRKLFEKTLDKYETHLNRYYVLSKQKEASALREDAFQMYELRKSYIKTSTDHFLRLVSFKATLENMLVACFSSALGVHIEEIDESAYACKSARSKLTGWREWLEENKTTTSHQIRKIKKHCVDLQSNYIAQTRPHRSLKCYSTQFNDQMCAVVSSSNIVESGEDSSQELAAKQLDPSTIGTPSSKRSTTRRKGKQGYLNSRIITSKSTRPAWARRWFFLQDGWFGTCTVNSSKVPQKGCIVLGDRSLIADCIFRVCTDMDRRYCFEVTHPTCTYYLQAETEEEMQQWLWAIEYQIEKKQIDASSLSSAEDPGSPQALLSPTINTSTKGNKMMTKSTSPSASPDGILTPTVSTTSSSLTKLMIREAANKLVTNDPTTDLSRSESTPSLSSSHKQNSSVSSISSAAAWGMPWLTTSIHAFSNSDEELIKSSNNDSIIANQPSPTDQLVVWPTKVERDVPRPPLSNYSVELESSQRELRKVFMNVPKDEVVIESFLASLYHEPTSVDNEEGGPTDNISYGYSGTAYITQTSFWFYSCTLMTCVNMVVIPLEKINDIRIENSQKMVIETKPDTHDQQSFSFHLWLASADIISEKLKHAVNYVTGSNEDEKKTLQQLFDTVRNITPASKLNKNKTPTNHITTTSSALYASVTPLTVQAHQQPIANVSSSTDSTMDNNNDDSDSHKSGSASNNITAITQDALSDQPETSDQQHRGSPAQGALEAVAAKNKKHLSNLSSASPPPPPAPERSNTPLPPAISIKNPTSKSRKGHSGTEEDTTSRPNHIAQPTGEVRCECSSHPEKLESELVLPTSADHLFDVLFRQSHIWQMLNRQKQYGEPNVSLWKHNVRILRYRMPVSNPMVKSKDTEVVETQRILTQRDHLCYVVKVTTKTPDLPYADAFIPMIQYCITYVSPTSCRLKCWIGVDWLKSIFVKGVVNRAAMKGMQETVAGVLSLIKQALKEHPGKGHQIHGSTKTPTTNKQEKELPPITATTTATVSTSRKRLWMHGLTMLLSLVCLVLTAYQSTQFRSCSRLATVHQKDSATMLWRGVYLRDVDQQIITNTSSHSLPFVNPSLYDLFKEETAQDSVYVWTDHQHRWMAAELGYARERLGALRYDLLCTFRILNKVELQLLENEYWNWVSDKRNSCKEKELCESLRKEEIGM